MNSRKNSECVASPRKLFLRSTPEHGAVEALLVNSFGELVGEIARCDRGAVGTVEQRRRLVEDLSELDKSLEGEDEDALEGRALLELLVPCETRSQLAALEEDRYSRSLTVDKVPVTSSEQILGYRNIVQEVCTDST